MPMTIEKILMKSSGSTTAMVMERSVGDVCLRRVRCWRGSAAGGQVRNDAKPQKRESGMGSEGFAQQNDALLMLCA